ncbi:MAG: hypothetical protein JEZ12_11530 [Desulfobacterium sp.]|nr:hypothetical protein [Desulfobacterium sp.]
MTEIVDKKMLMDEFEKASTYLEAILSGKTTLAKAAKVSTQELDELFTKAQTALQLEDFPKAEELFTTLLVLNNKDTRAAMGLAGALEGQAKYEFAMPVYFLVLATTLYDPVAPFRAGICLMHLGKKEEAIKLFQLAADCKGEIKNPKKQVYIEKANGMLKALAAN